jgi:UDP-N-acetylglucosamine--N-acetylmuramyl-(pentapeptide) pyrophosphoryl-undecaprenol N-acetylglucosamine transferase
VSMPTLLIAGGGTGGHVFPAVAVAEAAQALADVDVVFVGTDRGVEARVVPARGWRLERLDVEPMKGGGATRAIRGALVAMRATLHAAGIVRRLRPRAVLSVGGYASGPATLAAALLGVPVAVLEPNSTVGFANRVLAPFARRAFVAWDEAVPTFRARAVRQYGVPLRAGFTPRPSSRRDATVRVLVMGGSQGAAFLNERLPEAFGRLGLEGRPVDVLHQAGRDREAPVRAAYERAKVARARVVAFIDDVAQAIADADLVVARAGAGTIAEITAIGRASVLVPFPHAADDHQARNAQALERAGGAVCVLQKGADQAVLVREIGRLLADDLGRRAMADRARARGRPDAAQRVARDLLALGAIEERPPGAPRLRSNGGPN